MLICEALSRREPGQRRHTARPRVCLTIVSVMAGRGEKNK